MDTLKNVINVPEVSFPSSPMDYMSSALIVPRTFWLVVLRTFWHVVLWTPSMLAALAMQCCTDTGEGGLDLLRPAGQLPLLFLLCPWRHVQGVDCCNGPGVDCRNGPGVDCCNGPGCGLLQRFKGVDCCNGPGVRQMQRS